MSQAEVFFFVLFVNIPLALLSLAVGTGVRGREPNETDRVDCVRRVHRALRCGVPLRPTKKNKNGKAARQVGVGRFVSWVEFELS